MDNVFLLIDKRVNDVLNNNNKIIKSAVCKVIGLSENNKVKVKSVDNGIEYTVFNYSGSDINIGESVRLFYNGNVLNENNAYIGASLYKKSSFNSDKDYSLKNITMNTDIGNNFTLAYVNIMSVRETNVIMFFNADLYGNESKNIEFSVFVDGNEYFYNPIVSITEQKYTAVNFSIPILLETGSHYIEIKSSDEVIAEKICAFISGQNIKFVYDETFKNDYIYISDESVTIKKYIGTSINPAIPTKIEGLPVKKIGGGAFSETEVESVKIPEGGGRN